MNRKELVSILIPVYNREKYIKETIESGLNQTYSNIEIIVFDNHSDDDTWKILTSNYSNNSKIKLFRNEQNIGPVRNWALCINAASGVYGKILWSDDLLDTKYIERTINFLKNDDVGLVFTKALIFNEEKRKKIFTYNIGNSGKYSSNIFIENVLSGKRFPKSPGCAIFRLKDLKKSLTIDIPNKINVDFSMTAIGNDLLFFLLTLKDYPYFYFINEPLSLFREHNESISISTSLSKQVLLYALAKSYFLENNISEKKIILKNNTYLFLLLIKFRKNELGLKNISSFYLRNKMLNIDKLFLAITIFRSLFNAFKVYFVRK